MGWLIILGSLPIGVLGLLLEDYIDTQFRSLWVVATMLIVFAVFLGLADRFGREQRELKDLTFRHGILYGFAQALALIPGVSRSGGTITAGLFMGYTREVCGSLLVPSGSAGSVHVWSVQDAQGVHWC